MSDILLDQITSHWNDLRGRTVDMLAVLTPEDLPKRLPFPESQSIYYQFRCMLGTIETYARLIESGEWPGWSSSLPVEPASLEAIQTALRHSDELLVNALGKHDLMKPYGSKGKTPMLHYLELVEHEAHHHGQLINFIYALNLLIPQSWAETWALSR